MEIDLTQQEPIPYKNTIAILNEYILQNIDLLNKFGHFNESKLYEMEVILDETESKILLLEKKLDSIPPELYNGLVLPEKGKPIVVQHTYPQESIIVEPEQYQQQQQQQQQQPEQQPEQQVEIQEQKVEEAAPEPEVEEVDERLQKYIKLLSYGVVPAQLKMKMQMEGVDPNLLDAYLNKN